MDVPLFLTHSDSVGVNTHIELKCCGPRSVFYLPDEITAKPTVSRERDDQHSSISLEVGFEHCLLSVWCKQPGPTVSPRQPDSGIPSSTPPQRLSINVAEGQRFGTPAGEWQLRWDRDGNLSDLTRPRPLLLVDDDEYEEEFEEELEAEEIELIPFGEGDKLVDIRRMNEIVEEEEHETVPIIEIHLPPALSESDNETDGEKQHTKDNLPENAGDSKENGTSDTLEPTDRVLRSGATCRSNVIDRTSSEASELQQVNKTRHRQHTTEPEHSLGADQQMFVIRKARSETSALVADGTNQPGEIIPVEVDNHDQEAASEDESQALQDHRAPKRKLSEIESSSYSPRNKRSKPEGIRLNRWLQPSDASNEQHDTENFVQPFSRKTAGSKKESRRNPKAEEGNLARTTRKTTPRSGRGPMLNLSSAPARRSSQQAPEVLGHASIFAPASHEHSGPKVIFSSTSALRGDKKTSSVIERLGGAVVTGIDEADVLCVGDKGIKKTGKFIIAVVKGKDIVTDDWLRRAYATGRFPERRQFLPKDLKHEQEWDFSLREAVSRGRAGLQLLEGVHVHLTRQLRRDLGNLTKDLKQVALALGAAAVRSALPKKDTTDKVLMVGSGQNVDPEAAKVARLGHKLYRQDVLTMAALRGRLELESDEFLVEMPVKGEPLDQ